MAQQDGAERLKIVSTMAGPPPSTPALSPIARFANSEPL
jgi:hypothetical protein